jgi:uncharacterized protein (DUF4415 family)
MASRLTKSEKAALAQVAELPDDQIDTSDPDAPERLDWTGAERGRFYRPVKKQTTIRIDADVLEWFRHHPRGRGYQSHINAALREYVLRKEREGA